MEIAYDFVIMIMTHLVYVRNVVFLQEQMVIITAQMVIFVVKKEKGLVLKLVSYLMNCNLVKVRNNTRGAVSIVVEIYFKQS